MENDEESVQVQTLTANKTEIANVLGRDEFEQIESSDIQELLESRDEDLTETDLEEMLNSQPLEEEGSTCTGNVIVNLKNFSEGLRIANEIRDFFMNIDPSIDEVLFFKRQIASATAAYQPELKERLKLRSKRRLQNSSIRCLSLQIINKNG